MATIFKIQQFLSNCILSVLSLLKIILTSSFFIKPPKVTETGKTCIILGNGPSLNKTLENDFEKLLSNDLMCVNQFADTEYYEKLKPEYYIIQADQLLLPKAVEYHDKVRKILFNNIAAKTTWKLILFLPVFADKSSFWKNIIKDNKNIHVCYYNPTPVEGLQGISHWLFKRNLGMPRPHNVLIPGIIQAINMGYSTVFITGADHSWHEEFLVDENNNFKFTDTHFFSVNNKPVPRITHTGTHFLIHEAFRKFYLTFLGYHILKEYAENENVNIYNASYKSYIDAFERKSLSTL